MKISITTYGASGDIQLHIAFARGLQPAQYHAAICTPETYGRNPNTARSCEEFDVAPGRLGG